VVEAGRQRHCGACGGEEVDSFGRMDEGSGLPSPVEGLPVPSPPPPPCARQPPPGGNRRRRVCAGGGGGVPVETAAKWEWIHMAGWVRATACPHRLEDEPRSMAGKEWEEAALPPRKNESEISERRPSATQLAPVEKGSMFRTEAQP